MNPNSPSPDATCQSASQPDAATRTNTVKLEIKGLHHVPSFKNNKSIFRNAEGKPFIATNPKRREWMDKATHLIGLQLLSASQTTEPGTLTARHLRSWIVSSLPGDDSWQWVREIHILTEVVGKGDEGCVVEIEKISAPK